ncbi:MAG TPA: thrombospondin type 3 repeat-containing protein [Candidatus Pacearchaeota archaeon]|nr:thrombospondin type 3 repeat-containing protein [Candidatus Pacearchaeota archaeon]
MSFKKNNLSILFLLLVFPFFVFSQTENDSFISAFQDKKIIKIDHLSNPTVVEISLNGDYNNKDIFAVYNKTTSSFEPYYIKSEILDELNHITLMMDNGVYSHKLNDNDLYTYEEFDALGDSMEEVMITLKSDKVITSDSLTVLLDKHVALPNKIKISVLADGREKNIINKEMNDYKVYFPKTSSNEWLIHFYYSQPLRIAEIKLHQIDKISINSLRFLAQPENDYILYLNPDRVVDIKVGEAGNLFSDDSILILDGNSLQSLPNSDYILADIDNDGVPDIRDNCINVPNPEQEDLNNNGKGDVCEDYDKDGVINKYDNCPNTPNKNQLDSDNDNIGDVCDNEESRFTEKYAFIPWLGIIFAFVTIIILFMITYKKD